METVRAFVGHSFSDADSEIVRKVLDFLTSVKTFHPTFSWVHAESAAPTLVDAKVLSLIQDANVFIGICTKNERVVRNSDLRKNWRKTALMAAEASFLWKTSDWIIQEIGLAVGRDMHIILLLEEGVRPPGSLQGNLEHLNLVRDRPEACFQKLLEILGALTASAGLQMISDGVSKTPPPHEDPQPDVKNSESEATADQTDEYKPQPTWSRFRYELAMYRTVNKGDVEAAAEISREYLKSDDAKIDQNTETWLVFHEYVFLTYGRGGDFNRLKEYVAGAPDSSRALEYLATLYKQYCDFVNASKCFLQGAQIEQSHAIKIRMYGESAECLQKAGSESEALSLLKQIKAEFGGDSTEELAILHVERKLSALRKEDHLLVAALERCLAINPADSELRFELAFKYSAMGVESLALWHYLRVPAANRTSALWNNLGVSYSSLKLHAKSVHAYEKSQAMGGALAMSNLANRLMGEGFVVQAQELLEMAIALPNHEKEVETAFARLKEMPDAEEKIESEEIEKSRALGDFYRDFGHALVSTEVALMPLKFKDSLCTLDVSIRDGRFVAVGQYTLPKSGLSTLIKVSETEAPAQLQIVYEGDLRGRAVVGRVTRKRLEGKVTVASLLGTLGNNETKIMLRISEDGKEIRICEYEGGVGKFHSLIAV